MTELIKILKELEKSFSDNRNKSAIIFDEAKKRIIDSNKIKISESEIELLSGIKNILQILYFGLYIQVIANNPKDYLVKYPEIPLSLQQISSEIIDILEEISLSIIYGRNMIGFSLTRMLKERILTLMILTEDSGKLPDRCKMYYDFYKEFTGKFFSDDPKDMSSHYWWNQLYPKKSISGLMIHFKISGYSHDSYHSHGGYGTHLDCNISRGVTDTVMINSSRALIYEYFWIAGYEMLALSIDGFAKFNKHLDKNYYDSVMKLLDDLYALWSKAELECYESKIQ